MRERVTQSSQKEMDGSGVQGDEFVPEEEQFTGNELDEELDEGGASIPEEDNSQGIERNYAVKRWLLLCIGLGLCILAGIGCLAVKWKWSTGISNQNEKASQYNRIAIPEDRLLVFHSFVIPFHENKDFTYISFRISFNVPNRELRKDMIRKKRLLRGIMYDMVTQEVNKRKEVPPLEVLKEVILKGVSAILSGEGVDEVYITGFLAV